MNKKFRKLILPASLLLASQSYALGLGGLQINSALDEVLNGEIPFVIDSSEEIESIEVAVASSSDYKKVGLDKSYVPSNIKVNIVEKNGQKYVQVSSIGPISEPIVSLLLVVDWSNGHLLREYTILLDPPLFNNSQTNEYSKPVETNTYVAPQQIETKVESSPKTNTQIRTNANTYNSSSQVVVESGDTLWKIASRYNDGSGPQQMMVAIFNNNPGAFQSNDMNRLRKGAILTIPDSDQVSMVSNGQAITEVRSHMQNWSRLQTADSSTDANESSSSDYGIELVPPSDSDSSQSGGSSGNSSSNRVNVQTVADLNRANEELVSSNLENSELSNRVKELESIVQDQKLALSLKDSDLAQLQEQIQNEDQSTPVDVETHSNEMTNDDVWDEAPSESVDVVDNSNVENMDSDDTSVENMDSDDSDTMESTDIVDNSEMNLDDEMQGQSMDEMIDTSSSGDTVVIEEVGNDTAESTEATPSVNEKSLMEKIMEYKYEGLIGLGVLLLGLLGFVFFKRKGDDDLSDSGGFLDSISNDESDSANTLDDFNSPLDGSSTELDLSNLEDFDELDDDSSEVASEVQDIDVTDQDLEDEPEVVVMNDSDDDLEEDTTEELEELDLDLDIDLEDELEDESISENFEEELETDEIDFDENDNTLLDGGGDDSDAEELSLDFELDDLDLDEESEEEFDFDLDVSSEDLEKVTDNAEELDDLVFDTGERTIVDAVESIGDGVEEIVEDTVEEASEELEDLEFDLSDDLFDTDDLDLDLDEESDDEDVTELNLETLSEEDLSLDDLGELEEELEPSLELEESTEPDDADSELDIDNFQEEDVDIGLDFDDLASDDAMDTKLDLAKAYFEMGDIDGAKQMVTEIIEEGNDEQKSKAEILKNEIEG